MKNRRAKKEAGNPEGYVRRMKQREYVRAKKRFHATHPKWAGRQDVLCCIVGMAPNLELLLIAALGGDAEAQSTVLELALRCTRVVDLVAYVDPRFAESAAQVRTSWPVALSYHPELRKVAIQRFNALPLARKTALVVPAKKHPHTLFKKELNHLVWISVVKLGLQGSQNLPEMDGSATVAAVWFEAVWADICADGPPEKSHLRRYGVSTANTQSDAYPLGSKAYESRVHDGIRQQLRKAFDRIFRSSE